MDITTLDTLPLTEDTLRLTTDLDALHRHVWRRSELVSGPASGGRTSRREAGLQFLTALPGERFGSPDGITLLGRRGADLPDAFEAGETAQLFVRVAAERRNGSYAAAVEDLDSEHRVGIRTWVTDLLARHGLAVDEASLSITPVRRMGSRRARKRIAFATRDVSATVTVTDAQAANAAYRNGVGRGKSYGLGMLIRVDNHGGDSGE